MPPDARRHAVHGGVPHGREQGEGAMANQMGVYPRDLREEAEAGTIPHARVGLRGLLFEPRAVFEMLCLRATGAIEVDGGAQ